MAIDKKISIQNVSIKFPLNNVYSNSLRHRILNLLLQKKHKNEYYYALNNISLELNSGDRVALIGNNGAGKTTLLRTISNIYEPTTGKIDVVGSIGSFIDMTMGMSMEATGEENIYIRGILGGMRIDEIKNKKDQIIEFAGLGNFIKQPLKTYSSGMIMRLGFSILTSLNADIVLMDEWLSTGDVDFQKKATQKIYKIIDNSHIFIMASHSDELIKKICNKVVKIDKGSVIEVKEI